MHNNEFRCVSEETAHFKKCEGKTTGRILKNKIVCDYFNILFYLIVSA